MAGILLRQLIEQLKQQPPIGLCADTIELDVLRENTAAVRLYLRTGFRITRLLPDFYRIDGQQKDAYHMVYNL